MPVATGGARQPSRALTAVALAALVGMAMLWGSTFFSMKGLTGRMPVPDLLAVRFLVAATATALVGFRHLRMSRDTLRHGMVIGAIYGVAQLIQTQGLAMTTASANGFITGLYVVLTPFLAARVLKEKVPGATWFAVLLAVVGLGTMTIDTSKGFAIGPGELLTLASAVLYACHITCVDRWATAENSMSITIVQLATIAVVCTGAALPGGLQLPSGSHDWWLMLYLAIIAGVIPIFLQVWAQTIVESTTAAVLMAGEPVWAAVFAVWWGGEHVTWQMVCGGGAIFAAMVLVTILPRLRSRNAG